MVAEDHADSSSSAKSIYNVIRQRLSSTSRDNLLPLVYLIDSILKNVKGEYIPIIEKDAKDWLSTVHGKLPPPQQAKLQRVFKTWGENHIFTPESLKIMGRCFDDRTSGKTIGANVTQIAAGISRTSDGALLLPATLRREMQAVLDELQSGTENELEKVSLERLADLNPDLLANIKSTAEGNMASTNYNNGHASSGQKRNKPAFLQHDLRTPEAHELEHEWDQLVWDTTKTDQVVHKLRYRPNPDDVQMLYTQHEAMHMTVYLATGEAVASLIESTLGCMLEQQQHNHTKQHPSKLSYGLVNHRSMIDKALFTNQGIQQKNETAFGYLYQMGLPFVSSSDGRRFATQLELSQHLDALFKKSQLEKTMARTEERGWCVPDTVWTRLECAHDDTQQSFLSTAADQSATSSSMQLDDVFPADEARDRCVVCGINFKMFFDNDNGMYMYQNCREVSVENDDAAEEETSQLLVHVTCWRALGSPEVLTMDQALQETLRHL
jgi:pre-mRNA cleavage complex 2 protein Pcf11